MVIRSDWTYLHSSNGSLEYIHFCASNAEYYITLPNDHHIILLYIMPDHPIRMLDLY